MIKPKVIIYDCDGVLIDSKKANEVFYNHILKHFGMPPLNREQLEFVHVSTALGAIEHLFQSTNKMEEAKAYLKVIDNTPFILLLRLEPHIRTVLECLRPNYHTAIATNRGLSMPLIMEKHRLGELFDMVVTTLDVRNPKPDPECLFKILRHFKADPHEALYIGDSEVDRLVSEVANVHFAAYKNTQLKAAYHFNDHMDLLSMLSTPYQNES